MNKLIISFCIAASMFSNIAMADQVSGTGSANTKSEACEMAKTDARSRCPYGVESYETCSCEKEMAGRASCDVNATCKNLSKPLANTDLSEQLQAATSR